MNSKIKKLHTLFTDPGISIEERRTVAVKILEALGPNLLEESPKGSKTEKILVKVDGDMLSLDIHNCKRIIEIRERMVEALQEEITINQERHDLKIRSMEIIFESRLERHKLGLLILSLSLSLIFLILFLNSLNLK